MFSAPVFDIPQQAIDEALADGGNDRDGKFLIAARMERDFPIEENAAYLRRNYRTGGLPSSDRWYVETQPLQLAYVLTLFNTSAPVAYSIPFYKLFDTDDAHISDSILPCDVEPELSEHIYSESAKSIWTEAMKI